ncbi:hypothetical protein JGI20_01500 [Candidatus Kryptobacter tengchongensis]|uniref:Uncharacterized protein n=1 Tax=Kryptobacter tengchongensis TaxID=1643429 RepID=A0A916LKY1_KRYT1|nr:hypothetical protein JGI20_01500 [Candidatus Kryptobacter tengchongensis]CUT05884.1 hypothetical protein JGI25_01672 [Candidatus Kryptobacter tengchongensis]
MFKNFLLIIFLAIFLTINFFVLGIDLSFKSDIVARAESSGGCENLGCGWPGFSICYEWDKGRCYYPYTIIQ